jgi:hypothetical protein
LDVQVNNHKTIIGDSAGAFNKTSLAVDDIGQTITATVGGFNVLDTSSTGWLEVIPLSNIWSIGIANTQVSGDISSKQVSISGGLILPSVVHTNTNYVVADGVQEVIVDTFTASGPITITLPNVSSSNGRLIWIKAGNKASTNTITIIASSGGVEQNLMNVDNQAVCFYGDNGTITWRPISSYFPTASAGFVSNDLTGQTGAVSTVTTLTPPNDGKNRTYSIGAYLNVVAVTLDVIKVQVTYTDENGTPQTEDFFPSGLTSSALSTIGNNPMQSMTIRSAPNNPITIKTILTTGTGSISYDVGGWIQQVN